MTVLRFSMALAGLTLLPGVGSAQTDGIRWQCAAPISPARDHHVVFSARVGRSDVIYAGGGTNYRAMFE